MSLGCPRARRAGWSLQSSPLSREKAQASLCSAVTAGTRGQPPPPGAPGHTCNSRGSRHPPPPPGSGCRRAARPDPSPARPDPSPARPLSSHTLRPRRERPRAHLGGTRPLTRGYAEPQRGAPGRPAPTGRPQGAPGAGPGQEPRTPSVRQSVTHSATRSPSAPAPPAPSCCPPRLAALPSPPSEGRWRRALPGAGRGGSAGRGSPSGARTGPERAGSSSSASMGFEIPPGEVPGVEGSAPAASGEPGPLPPAEAAPAGCGEQGERDTARPGRLRSLPWSGTPRRKAGLPHGNGSQAPLTCLYTTEENTVGSCNDSGC